MESRVDHEARSTGARAALALTVALSICAFELVADDARAQTPMPAASTTGSVTIPPTKTTAATGATAAPAISSVTPGVTTTASAAATASAPGGAPSDAPSVASMTLPDAQAYARAHQPLMKVAMARIDAAKAVARIPDGQWRPQLGALAELLGGTANNTTASYTSDPILDIPRIGATPATTTGSFRPYASSFLAIGASQEVFDFGRIAAQSVALEAFVDVERAAADVEVLDLQLAVQESFYAVLGSKAVVAAAEAAYDRTKAHRDFAQAGVDNKLLAPIELARADADLARFDVGRIRARGGLDLARSVFAAAVGVPQPMLDAAGELSAPSALPPLASAIADAEKRDPVIRLALAQVTAEEANTTAIGAEMRPNVFLSATLSGRAGGAPPTSGGTPFGSGFVPVVPNWDVGLVLSWPLFDGVNDARVSAAKAKEETARSVVDVRKQEAVAEIRQAYFAVRVADESLPALERSVDAARINYTQASARFKGGLATSLEVADAEAILTDAEIQLAIGRFQLAKARAIFGRTIAEGL